MRWGRKGRVTTAKAPPLHPLPVHKTPQRGEVREGGDRDGWRVAPPPPLCTHPWPQRPASSAGTRGRRAAASSRRGGRSWAGAAAAPGERERGGCCGGGRRRGRAAAGNFCQAASWLIASPGVKAVRDWWRGQGRLVRAGLRSRRWRSRRLPPHVAERARLSQVLSSTADVGAAPLGPPAPAPAAPPRFASPRLSPRPVVTTAAAPARQARGRARQAGRQACAHPTHTPHARPRAARSKPSPSFCSFSRLRLAPLSAIHFSRPRAPYRVTSRRETQRFFSPPHKLAQSPGWELLCVCARARACRVGAHRERTSRWEGRGGLSEEKGRPLSCVSPLGSR